jgi:hypothetical protein
MSKLVFDIETIGHDFDLFDETTKEVLTSWIEKSSNSEEEYNVKLEELKNGLGFSPLTGEIVAIGILDYDKDQGVVYYQAPGQNNKDFEDSGIRFKQMSEKEMLKHFWKGAMEYDEFITFNGRAFDVPFMIARSAKYGIKPSKDLMSYRYSTQQKKDSLHTDLYDQLSYYGAVRKAGNLHMWCRHFGIESPKAEGVKGDDVTLLFNSGKCLDIAKYNVRDIKATAQLYNKWSKLIKF